jgi:hypothetical protein
VICALEACGGAQTKPGTPATCRSPSASGACNDVTDLGGVVSSTCAVGPVPSGTGGAISAGTYVLTAIVGYDCGDAGGPPAQSQTLVISGSDCLQGVAHVSGQVVTDTASFVVSGNEVTASLVCPAGQSGTQTSTFTATPSSLTEFHPSPFNQVEYYSRQ